MSTSQFPQHERLTRVLNIYRSAMRRHIAEQWRGKHGDEWFHEMFSYLTEHQQQEITNTREALSVQRANGEITLSQDEEDEFLIDISMFLESTKSRSDLFGSRLTSQENTAKMYAVYQLRNKWAHPPLRDLRKPEVDGAIEYCATILDILDPAAADAVWNAATDEAQSTPPDQLLERLDQLQDVIEARSLPTDLHKEILGQLLKATTPSAPEREQEAASDDLAAEVRALRADLADLAASRTRLGDWWGRCEREILVWWDRLMGRR